MVALVTNVVTASSYQNSLSAKDAKETPEVVLTQSVYQQPREPVDAPIVEKVGQAVQYINDYVQKTQRDLQFSIDDNSGQTVIKVLDRTSGDLIRQIPNQAILELAKSLALLGELNLISVNG